MSNICRILGRRFGGLWRRPAFVRLWLSLSITSFGAQVTNLALPLTAAVLILFATRDLDLSPGAIGLAYAFGGFGCVLAASFAQRLPARLGIGPVIVHGLILTAPGWQAFGLVAGPPWMATLATVIGLRATLLTVGALGLVLSVAAVLWLPVRRHRTLSVVAPE